MSQLPSQPPVTPIIASHVVNGSWRDVVRLLTTLNIPNNGSISISGWFYVKGNKGYFNCNATVNGSNIGWGIYSNLSRGWHYLTWTWTNETGSDATVNTLRVENYASSYWENSDNEAWGCNYQVELKPFATSFVDGTRAAGKMKTDIPVDPNNFVISFWFKPDWKWGTSVITDASEQSYNLLTYGIPGTNGFLFRIKEYTYPGEINLATYAPANRIEIQPSSFGLTNHDWAYFVLIQQDIELRLYINGVLAITNSNPSYDPPTDNILWIGSRLGNSTSYGLANGLFSDILIHPNPNIWTDEYIKQVYDMKSSFFVPPRAIVH